MVAIKKKKNYCSLRKSTIYNFTFPAIGNFVSAISSTNIIGRAESQGEITHRC